MAIVVETSNSRHQDRRRSMPFFCAFHVGIKAGKRRSERRTTRGKPVYVDAYPGHLVLCICLILLLSACDAFLTLNILANGGEELNWFMAVLIEDSIEKFVVFKLALTAMALILLSIHHDVQIVKNFRVRYFKYMILSAYGVLIGYEIFLLDLATAIGLLS